MDRRSFLLGTLAGLGAGVLAGGFAAYGAGGDAALRKIDTTSHAAAPTPVRSETGGYTSYAQQGEDLVIARVFEHLHLDKPTYIDIGAHDPIVNNNTYLFYAHGSHGVLVEPNPYYAARLRAARPLDKVVEAGIGTSEQAQADYYVIRGDGQLNTFSKEQADEIVKRDGPEALVKVVKMPLLDVNKVLAEGFPPTKDGVGHGPDILSVDTEGLDYDILRTLDFGRFRPLVICAETSQTEAGDPSEKILELMARNDYVIRGSTFVNTVFVDRRRLPGALPPAVPAVTPPGKADAGP